MVGVKLQSPEDESPFPQSPSGYKYLHQDARTRIGFSTRVRGYVSGSVGGEVKHRCDGLDGKAPAWLNPWTYWGALNQSTKVANGPKSSANYGLFISFFFQLRNHGCKYNENSLHTWHFWPVLSQFKMFTCILFSVTDGSFFLIKTLILSPRLRDRNVAGLSTGGSRELRTAVSLTKTPESSCFQHKLFWGNTSFHKSRTAHSISSLVTDEERRNKSSNLEIITHIRQILS